MDKVFNKFDNKFQLYIDLLVKINLSLNTTNDMNDTPDKLFVLKNDINQINEKIKLIKDLNTIINNKINNRLSNLYDHKYERDKTVLSEKTEYYCIKCNYRK